MKECMQIENEHTHRHTDIYVCKTKMQDQNREC